MTDYTKEIIKRSKHDETFKIIRYVEIEGLQKSGQKPNMKRFVSPLFGSEVPDDIVVPDYKDELGDNTKRLDPFRVIPKQSAEELEKYDDFNILTHKARVEYLGGRDYSKEKALKAEQERLEQERKLKEEENALKQEEERLNEIERERITKERLEKIFEEGKADPFTKVEDEYKEIVIKPLEEDLDIEDPSPGLYSEPIEIKSKFDDYVEKEITREKTVERQVKQPKKKYVLPDHKMFSISNLDGDQKPKWLLEHIETINNTLEDFGVEGQVNGSTKGPTVSRYEISLKPGVKVNRVTNIQDNLTMALEATSLRIEAPIPGKPYVGLEVPNREPEIVPFGNVVNDDEFIKSKDKPLLVALGVDIDGKNIYADISKMPHGLIAGSTGSGKSVCINTILASLLLKNTPDDLKLLLIDPKFVELQVYRDLPHLITPVINDLKMASEALKWVVTEMEERYLKLSEHFSKDIKSYNEGILNGRIDAEKMPYIVIVIDELADLMNVAAQEVETSIQRITQKARAAGIHLIVATQRPSVDVIKGTIKSNIPTRVAFKVSSYVDSQTILDNAGADKLLGMGDMLFKLNDQTIRLQGAYIKDEEIMMLREHILSQSGPDYLMEHKDIQRRVERDENKDELFEDVARFVVIEQRASINQIQDTFSIGFNRASNIVKSLEGYQIVSEAQGTKPREVLVTLDELEEILANA